MVEWEFANLLYILYIYHDIYWTYSKCTQIFCCVYFCTRKIFEHHKDISVIINNNIFFIMMVKKAERTHAKKNGGAGGKTSDGAGSKTQSNKK